MTYIAEGDYLRVITRGPFSVETFSKMVEEMVTHESWRPGLSAFIDHRDSDMSTASFLDVAAAADVHRRMNKLVGCSRIASLMRGVTDFGVGRQYQNLIDGDVSSNLRIFADEEKAMNWLLEAPR